MKISQLIYVSLAFIICALLFQIWEQDKHVQSLESTVAYNNAELITRRNDAGKLITEKLTAETRVKELEHTMPKLAEQIKRDFDIKLRHLKGYMQTTFEATGNGNATINRIPFGTDSSTLYLNSMTGKIRYHNGKEWMTFNPNSAKINFEPFAIMINDGYLACQTDVYNEYKTPYVYTYSDTAKMAFIKRGKFLHRKQLYGSVMFSNPNAKVVNTQSILVNEYDDKRFGIGPYIGWGVDQELNTQFTVGISVHYSLIRF